MALASVSLVIWTALVVCAVYCVTRILAFYLDYKRRALHVAKFPGVKPHPLWGHLDKFPGPNEEGLAALRDNVLEYPRINKVWYGPAIPSVSVQHPDTVKAVLKTSEPKALKMGAYSNVEPWLGIGLLLSSGKKWARNRRLLTPAFHFDILKPYMQINNKCVDKLIGKWMGYHKRGEYFETITHISQCTLDIILRCAFSYDNDVQDKGEQHPYVKAVTEMGVAVTTRLITPYLYPEPIFRLSKIGRDFYKNCNYVHKVSEEIIDKRKKDLKEHGESIMKNGRYLDFLDILLTAKDEDGKGLTPQEIRDEADTFLFEGHDTTASGISWTLYSLAEHPEHQKKCQEEIDALLDGRESDEIEWDDLPKLPYLTMCVKEAMRLHTPVPFIERETTKDMYLDGYFLPRGTVVDIQIYNLHHNPRVWEDPMEFRPERFTQENMKNMDSYAFVPFSAGPRNCIGQTFAMHEQKTVVARLLRKFDLSLDPNHKVGKQIIVVMKAENGIMMKATPRDCAH